jgi:hypothetical protein
LGFIKKAAFFEYHTFITHFADGVLTMFIRFFLALIFLLSAQTLLAANKPCSGKKGGIERCVGEKFLCVDGSISASKKVCSGYGESGSRSDNKSDLPAAGSDSSCLCSSGNYCTGPRGGRFCYNKNGNKSYLKK